MTVALLLGHREATASHGALTPGPQGACQIVGNPCFTLHHHVTMTTCVLAWAVALLLLPIVFILWATESRTDRARRWRAAGMSQQAIADRLGVSRSTVRRMLAA